MDGGGGRLKKFALLYSLLQVYTFLSRRGRRKKKKKENYRSGWYFEFLKRCHKPFFLPSPPHQHSKPIFHPDEKAHYAFCSTCFHTSFHLLRAINKHLLANAPKKVNTTARWYRISTYSHPPRIFFNGFVIHLKSPLRYPPPRNVFRMHNRKVYHTHGWRYIYRGFPRVIMILNFIFLPSSWQAQIREWRGLEQKNCHKKSKTLTSGENVAKCISSASFLLTSASKSLKWHGGIRWHYVTLSKWQNKTYFCHYKS